MWLLAGYKAPDHSTIARFRVGFLGYACENLFYQMVSRLFNAGELSKETVFIDDTKLEACGNKYTYVWKRAVSKWEENMFQKIQDEVQKINHEYIKSFNVKPISAAAKSLSNTSILPLFIVISALGSIRCTQSSAELALWSNCPGRNSTAMYGHPSKSNSVETLSVTISPKTE